MKVVLIPCGQCEWQAEGRLLGRVELALPPAGQKQCLAWAAQLKPLGLQKILHSGDELAAHTAALFARELGVSAKELDELNEVDVGLWAGLTDAQLKARYPSACSELENAPLNVLPPNGEPITEASDRVLGALQRVINKNGLHVIGVVLRPLALALAACGLEGRAPEDLLKAMRGVTEPVIIPAVTGTKRKRA